MFGEAIDFLQDGYDLISDLENKEKLDRLIAQAEEMGMDEAVAMVPMMLRGCSAEEYERIFGMKRNTLTQMFFRNMRKAADVAGIPGNASSKSFANDCNNVRDRCALKTRPE